MNGSREPIDLIMAESEGTIQFYIGCSRSMRSILLVHLMDSIAGVRLERVSDNSLPRFKCTCSAQLRPEYDFLYLRRGFDKHDLLTGMLSLLKTEGSSTLAAQLVIRLRPATNRRVTRSMIARKIDQRKCFSQRLRKVLVAFAQHDSLLFRIVGRTITAIVTRSAKQTPPSIGGKLDEPLFETQIGMRVSSDSDDLGKASEKLNDLIGATALFATPENKLVASRPKKSDWKPSRAGLCTAEEIALLWHPIGDSVNVAKVERQRSTQVEPPIVLPQSNRHSRMTPIGQVAYRKDKRFVLLPIESLRRHVYITGKTGVGKSTLMQSMFSSNMKDNLGAALIDPHGDLYEAAIKQVPRRRTNQVVLFDPSQENNIVPFNPLDVPIGMNANRVADGVIAAFVKIFGLDTATTPRLLHILRNSIATLIEQPDATLIGINRLLTDTMYRKSAVNRVSNPVVREFWHHEFGKWNERDRATFLASLQNKLGAFLVNRQMQLILGQPSSGFHMRKVMDDGQILLCNLSKGKLGEDSANLLGALLLSSMQVAGESRANIPETDRRDFVCFVDEVQNYSTAALATGLAEARKYRGPLFVLANQYLEQLSPDLRSAIIGNCGSAVVFQVGSEDAPFWSKHFGGVVTPDHLMAMPKYQAVTTILVDGMPTTPMTIRTLKPQRSSASHIEKLKRQAIRQFARPRSELELSTDALFR